MQIKEETRQVVIKTYVTDDGQEFDTEQAALNHEQFVKKQKADELWGYIEKHAIWMDHDIYTGIGAYIGGGCGDTAFVIGVDEKVVEWMEASAFYSQSYVENARACLGKKAFFVVNYDNDDLYFFDTIDHVIDMLAKEIIRINKWQSK